MSDYEDFESADSDLGTFEAELEVSGYDAMTSTQDGIRQDEFLKDSGMTIDMHGDAKEAKEKSEKKREKLNDVLSESFNQARKHLNDQPHKMKIGDGEYDVTHGEIKNFLSKQSQSITEKLRGETDAKKIKALEQKQQMINRMVARMEGEEINDEMMSDIEDMINGDAEMAKNYKLHFADNQRHLTADLNALEATKGESLIPADIDNDTGEVCLTSTFGQNSIDTVICEIDDAENEIGTAQISMSNHEVNLPDIAQAPQQDLQNTGERTIAVNMDF